MIGEGAGRPDVIVNILQAANFIGGVTLAKLREKVNSVVPQYLLEDYLSVLENNGLLSFQKGEQVYQTTYKGMSFLLAYKRAIGLITSAEKENENSFFKLNV